MESPLNPQETSRPSGSPPSRPLPLVQVFFYTGANPRNKSGVSWKVWQIARHGRTVTASWGSAAVEKRRPVPKGTLRSKTWRFATAKDAGEFETTRIHEKIKRGYYPSISQA